MTPQLRADARRNRERILQAASEVFAQEGTDCNVGEIARRAGVGHATVFRRFPTKDDLIVALLEERLVALAALAEDEAERDETGEGLERVMRAAVERQSEDRGFVEAIDQDAVASPGLREARARLHRAFEALVAKAQEAGRVRRDLSAVDALLLISCVGYACLAKLGPGDLWRRYLGIVLDGLRPEAATPLSPPGLSFAEVEASFDSKAAAARSSSR